MIKVLVVEDSAVVREFLVHILSSDPEIQVIGTACDGEQALEMVERNRPDIITMDIHMPKLDGLGATRRIMEKHPTPIVIVSGSNDPREVATTLRAIEAGALVVLPRPAGIGHPEYETTSEELVQTVKLMSEVKVVRRWAQARRIAAAPHPPKPTPELGMGKIGIVAIGASTGGPPVLKGILKELPHDFAAPILVVQHMAAGFTSGFVQWLVQSCSLPVHLATHGERIRPGHVYIAPDEFHMKVDRTGTIALTTDDPENGLRPSVSYLFRSVADAFGRHAVAGLLSGMGRDGTEELRLLKVQGALTFAQDKDSSVVHGMPGEAIKLDAATVVLPATKIAATLIGWVNNKDIRRGD